MRPALAAVRMAALLAMVGLAACRDSGRAGAGDREQTATPRPPSYDITFARTACYGACPDYVLTIDRAGNIKLHVPASDDASSPEPHPGTLIHGSPLAPARHAALIDLIEKRGFRELKRNYSIDVTDGSTTTITIDSPRGHWSTEVYMVPCFKQVGPGDAEPLRQMGITPFQYVPDVFCDLAVELDGIACEAYLGQQGLNPTDDMNPFKPSHCRSPR